MNKYLALKTKMAAVEVLKLIKEEHSYHELSSTLGLSAPVISRYINGHVLPSLERSKRIMSIFKKEHLKDLIMKKIRFEDNRVFDHSTVLYNTSLMDKIGKVALHDFSSTKVDNILTVETDGIPLAVQVGEEFGVNVVVAKTRKEMGVKNFVEVRRVYSSGAYSYLFIPKGAIRAGENVLIVDDAIRTGYTLETLLEFCRKCGAKAVGIFALVCFKDTLERLTKNLSCPIKVIIEL